MSPAISAFGTAVVCGDENGTFSATHAAGADAVSVSEGGGDAAERIRALGAEIAGQDEHHRLPPPPKRQVPRWLVRIRYLGLAIFAGQMIYAVVAHNPRVFIAGLVGFTIWLGLVSRG